jgi:hypothetical protein
MNRRFVDLPPPGYQQNDDSSDTKESIIQLLEQEREKENTVDVRRGGFSTLHFQLRQLELGLLKAIEHVYTRKKFTYFLPRLNSHNCLRTSLLARGLLFRSSDIPFKNPSG